MFYVSASGQEVYVNEQKKDFLLFPIFRLFRHGLRKSLDFLGAKGGNLEFYRHQMQIINIIVNFVYPMQLREVNDIVL